MNNMTMDNYSSNTIKCDIIDIIVEGHRFLLHIFLVSVITNLMDGNKDIISVSLLKTLLATLITLIIYHLFIKRILEPKMKKLKNICKKNEN